jgi:hypothetical protein
MGNGSILRNPVPCLYFWKHPKMVCDLVIKDSPLKATRFPKNIENKTDIPQLCHLRTINGESASFLFLKRLLRKSGLIDDFLPSEIEQILTSVNRDIDYLEQEDLSLKDIQSLLSHEQLPHNDVKNQKHPKLQMHRESSKKIIDILHKSILRNLDESYQDLSYSLKMDFLRNLMSFISRIARVKMLCVFHSFNLDSKNIQDLCFKKGFLENVKKELIKIVRLLIGGIYAYQFFEFEDQATEIVDDAPDPGEAQIQQMVRH